MKDTIKVIIDDKDILIANGVIVADSVLYKKVAFKFPEHWVGGDKSATFTFGNDKAITVRLNRSGPLWVEGDTYYIPHEAIKSPGFKISAFCVKEKQRIPSTPNFVKVLESGFRKGEAPVNPTPSEYERFISAANETKEIAQRVRDDAKAGKFNGISAYEVAVKNGYSGTEEEWLASLDGKQGDDGGYYKPSVEDGVISFEPSKEDMPPIENIDLKETLATKKEAFAAYQLASDAQGAVGTAQIFADNARALAEEAKAIAEGAKKGFVFDTETDLDAWLSDENNIGLLHLGDNLYIRDTNVPDYWWDGISKQPLEAKTDLNEYVKNTDYATHTKGGVIKISHGNPASHLYRDNQGLIHLGNTNETIDAKTNEHAIRCKDLDYATKVGITTNTIPLTPEEQAVAQNWLGGEMVKHLAVNENGYNLWELDEGFYNVEQNVKINFTTKLTNCLEGKCYAIVKRYASYSYITIFDCYNTNIRLRYGTTQGEGIIGTGFSDIFLNEILRRKTPEIIDSVKTFTKQPVIVVNLPAKDNSDAIPNTRWVQSELKNVKVDTDTSATPNTIPKRDSNASINVGIAIKDSEGNNYKGAAAPHTWVNALNADVNNRIDAINANVSTAAEPLTVAKRDSNASINVSIAVQDEIGNNYTGAAVPHTLMNKRFNDTNGWVQTATSVAYSASDKADKANKDITAITNETIPNLEQMLLSKITAKKITYDSLSSIELKPSSLYLLRASGKDVIKIVTEKNGDMKDSDGGSLVPSKTIGSYDGSRLMLLFIPKNLHNNDFYGCFAIGVPDSYLNTMAKSFYWRPNTDGKISAVTTDISNMMIWEIKL